MKKTCELDDTPDKDTNSYEADKENEVNVLKAGRKRKDGARASREGRKGLSKKQKVGNSTGDAVGQESPSIFAFTTKKTSFRKRKMLRQEKQLEEEEKNKKRIEELIVYFKNLDEQKLETT